MEHKRHLQVEATKTLFDQIIDRHAEAYLEVYPEVKEFSNFEVSATGNYYIGMVCTNDYEKPNTGQMKLRGSSAMTNNKMIELDLSAIDSQQCFFPGQVIAFFGDPFTSRQLTIRRMLDPMRIAPRMKSINSDKRINLLVACGPYMKPEHEDWNLFDKLIDSIKANEASHIVLLGPFVDLENKHLKAKYDVMWKTFMDKLVEGLFEHPCNVYVVPSNRDTLPSYLQSGYIYPTPELNIDLKLKVKPQCNIIGTSDPTQIDLGGIYLDTTSAEVVFHLNRCCSFVNNMGSPFSSLYRQLLTHGIYPIYPPPADTAIDWPKLGKHIQLDRLGAHIICLPSRYNTAVSNVENRLFITIKKCSSSKQAVLVEIPKIESSMEAPTDSIVITDYTHKIIDLCPVQLESEQCQPVADVSTASEAISSN